MNVMNVGPNPPTAPPCFLYTTETDEIPDDVQRVRIEPSVRKLADSAFLRIQERLSFLEFPNNAQLETLHQGVFMSYQALKVVIFPPSLRVIEKHAFLDCRNLVSVRFPQEGQLDTIEEAAFCECISLGPIEFPSTLSKIGQGAFHDCQKMIFPDLPQSLEAIDDDTFTSCESLQQIVLPPHFKIVGKRAFNYCSGLVSISLPQGITTIDEGAFNGCCSLLSIGAIPPSCTRLGRAAFNGCDALVSVELPLGLSVIAEDTFRWCTSLKTISIPRTVSILEKYAFANCRNLESVELQEGLEVIEAFAFLGCEALVNVAVPSTVFQMDSNAFSNCDLLLSIFSYDADHLTNGLMKRFEQLPVHRLLYFHLHSQTMEPNMSTTILEHLEHAMAEEIDCNEGGRDVFGMTPLHMIALQSSLPNVVVCRRLLAEYPCNLATRDSIRGYLPIEYACVRNAAVPIVELMANTQQTELPESRIDWTQLIRLSVEIASRDLLKFLVRQSVANRLQSLGLMQWKQDVYNAIDDIPEAFNKDGRRKQIDLVASLVAKYEEKEQCSLFELALWKMQIDKQRLANNYELTVDDRQNCRINCGDETIIPIVLKFLGTLKREILPPTAMIS